MIIRTGFADEIAPSLDTQLAVMNEIGLTHMEIRGVNGKGIQSLTLDEAEQVKKALDDAHVKVSAIGSPIGKIGVHEDFEQHLALLAHVIDLQKLLGAPYIRMFSFYMPKGETPEQNRDDVLRRMSAMIDLAVKKNSVLLHENEKGIYGDIAPRCLDLMRSLACDQFMAIFDFANFVQCGQNTLEAYDMLKPYIRYVHVKDALFGSGTVVPAGEGDGQVKTILGRLKGEGFDGFLSLEPHLVDFGGLAALERDHVTLPAWRTDGKTGFVTAYGAMNKLLSELCWQAV